MSILDRSALEESPLADLHAIASELSIDGYRRLRRPELVEAILRRQGEEGEEESTATPRRRGRRGGRARGRSRPEAASGAGEQAPDDRDAQTDAAEEATAAEAEPAEGEPAEPEPAEPPEPTEEPERDLAQGVVELLPNGSGFLRVSPPDPSDQDVYISAAQVKRCELISGDTVSGPRRSPRRSERFASLVRVDTVNGRPASELAGGARFDDLPAAFPQERFRLGSEDPTIKAIEWLAPFGRGSRVTIVGPARAGKTEALRRLAAVLIDQDEIEVSLALAGVRPEEVFEWGRGPLEPTAAVSLGTSPELRAQTIEQVVDRGRRLASRGAHAVVLVDTLEGLDPPASQKMMASARAIVDGGSLTLIATAGVPVGGETTVIALDPLLASTGRFPAVNLGSSWTIRPELLVGEAGAQAIARARLEASEGT